MEPTKRWDAEGRDVTSLPGLWSEEDRVPVADLERLEKLIKAAKHLLLAATGPSGGPTSWVETRRRWMEEVQ